METTIILGLYGDSIGIMEKMETTVVYGLGGSPNPVIVTIRDSRADIRVLLYSYYTTLTGWGGSS